VTASRRGGEARKRGLPVLRDTPAALAALRDRARTSFLTEMGVFTGDEIVSRYEIYAERYVKVIDIEARTLVEIAATQVMPALEAQLTSAFQALHALVEAGLPHERQTRRTRVLSELMESLHAEVERLSAACSSLHDHASADQAMATASDQVNPAMRALRAVVDAAEAQVADASWPLPKYREMVFAGV
jgi:glutamine synthetase